MHHSNRSFPIAIHHCIKAYREKVCIFQCKETRVFSLMIQFFELKSIIIIMFNCIKINQVFTFIINPHHICPQKRQGLDHTIKIHWKRMESLYAFRSATNFNCVFQKFMWIMVDRICCPQHIKICLLFAFSVKKEILRSAFQ